MIMLRNIYTVISKTFALNTAFNRNKAHPTHPTKILQSITWKSYKAKHGHYSLSLVWISTNSGNTRFSTLSLSKTGLPFPVDVPPTNYPSANDLIYRISASSDVKRYHIWRRINETNLVAKLNALSTSVSLHNILTIPTSSFL
jgi:hypothetical protein